MSYESGHFEEKQSGGSNNNWNGQQQQRSYGGGGGANSYGGNRGYNGGNQRGGFNRGNGYQRGGYGGRGQEGPPRDFTTNPPYLYRPYVVAGNKNVPEDIFRKLSEVREVLDKHKFTVRVAAFEDRPDKVFTDSPYVELILPWRNFANKESKHTFNSDEAKFFAKQYNPDYDTVPDAIKAFQATNVRLVCGQTLKSVAQFVLIWSEDGCENAKDMVVSKSNYVLPIVKMANDMRIPVFNIARSDAKERLFRFLNLETQPV